MSDFIPKRNNLPVTEIIEILAKNSSSIVEDFAIELKSNGKRITEGVISTSANAVFALADEMFAKKGTYPIEFFSEGVPRKVNMSRVLDNLIQISARSGRQFRLREVEDLAVPDGRFRDPGAYFSVQHEFPNTYGLSNERDPGPEVQQLRGYLRFYEQLFANFLSQLENVRNFFSIFPQDETYFSQELKNIPGAESISRAPKPEFDREPETGFTYSSQLKNLNDRLDPFEDRRNRVLDHLLARFAESFSSEELANYLAPQDIIACKELFLQHYQGISRYRGRGFNYILQSHNPHNVSGLEVRLCLKLGITGFTYRSLSDTLYENPNFQFFSETAEVPPKEIEIIDIHEDDTEEIIIFEKMAPEDKMQIDYEVYFVFIADDPELYYRVLANGTNEQRYSIKQLQARPGYVLEFEDQKGSIPLRIAFGPTEESLEEAKQFLINEFFKINKESEGMHLLEHILLRPDQSKSNFGYHIDDSKSGIYFRNATSLDFMTRTMYYTYLEEGHFELCTRIDSENCFILEALECDEVIGWFPELTFDEEPSADELERIKADLRNRIKQGALNAHVEFSPDILIHESFFSNRISAIFPDWPDRFQNTAFRELTGRTLHVEAPAQIHATSFWLNAPKLRRFERYYNRWRELKVMYFKDKDEAVYNELCKVNEALCLILKNLY